MLPLYLVKNNSSDAACRIVDNTDNTSTGSFDSHPFITVTVLLIITEDCRQDTQ